MRRTLLRARAARIVIALLLVPAAGWLPASRASACSRVDEALPPSNFESVMLADAVVLARADVVERPPDLPYESYRARFTVVETLAGTVSGGSFQLPAGGIASDRPEEGSFQTGRSGANCASCYCVYPYEPGGTYLLLLQLHPEGRWVLADEAGRAAERIVEARSPWLATVREYLRIASDPDPGARRRKLLALRERAARGGDSGGMSEALVEDIDAHLASPHRTKSFEELIAQYEASTDEDAARRVLWALGQQEDVRVDAFFRELRERALRGELRGARGEASQLLPVVERALRSQSVENVEDLVTLFPRLGAEASSVRHQIARALHGVCPRVPRAWILAVASDADDEELGALAQDFQGHLCEPAVAEVRRRVSDDYATADARFRFALARAGDAGIARWADAELDTPAAEESFSAYLLAISPGAEADAAIGRRIEAADDGVLALLVRVLLTEEVVAREERLAAVVTRLERGAGRYPKLRAALAELAPSDSERALPLARALDVAAGDG